MESGLQHLSVLDGAFLHLETAEMPMHVGSLHVFEPPAGGAAAWVDAVRHQLEQRLHLAPLFTRRLREVPLALANPVWVSDADVDLEHHVRHVRLPAPGTVAQLEALAARLHAVRLDRSRPLWEFTIIEALEDGRVGLYAKVHHAAIDGQAGVALANAVYDVSAEPRVVKPPRRAAGVAGAAAAPGAAALLGAALGEQWRQLVATARSLPPALGSAASLVRGALGGRRGAASGLLGHLKLAPATPFNVNVTNRRVFAGVALPFDEVRAIGRAHDASINDMVLWLVATALRRYLQRAKALPAQSLVAFVPVSMRAEGDPSANNQVTATLADLATQEADPLVRLHAILAATRSMKREIGAIKSITPTTLPTLGAPWLLSGLAALYGRSGLADRLRVANVAVSNVAGPRVALYLAGARMLSVYPVSVVVHGVALNVTVQSYENQLGFGLLACRRAVPDPARLAADLGRAMDELRSLPVPGPAPHGGAAPAGPPAAAARTATKRQRARKPG